MILTDASVFVDYLRATDPKLAALFPTILVGACGATRAELYAGVRGPTEHRKLVTTLTPVAVVATPETAWELVGNNILALRRAGLTVPFPDVVVATLGILANVEVWARDHHFPRMQAALPGLRLFVEPP